MRVVDSSGWWNILLMSPMRTFFAEAITETDNLIVPTISLLNHGQVIEGIRICNPFNEADTV